MFRTTKWHLAAACITLTFVAASLAGCSSTASTSTGKGDYTIALSNSYLGNSWRQTMVKAFERTAGEAKKQGLIKDFSVSNTSQNTAVEQIAQIKSLILKKPSAIVINSASPTALNPVIAEACAAGIKVVVFDSLASAECEYDVVNGFEDLGYQEAKLVSEAMGGKGNLLLLRGIVGSEPEKQTLIGEQKALTEYPNIKLVKELDGEASDATAQAAVQSALPSLPDIKGVVSNGASFGTLKAFESAGKTLPSVAFDNGGQSLRYWKNLEDSQGYQGSSVRSDPGQASAAVWVALALLNDQKVPKTTLLPIIAIDSKSLDAWIKVTPTANIATWLWTQKQTEKAIADNNAGLAVSPLPVPTEAP